MQTLRNRIGLLLFAAAFLSYLPGITWGLPTGTGPDRIFPWAYDDLSPLPALTETYHTFIRDSPDHWVAYPLLHYLTLTAAYSPYMLGLFVARQWSHPTPVYPFGFADPASSLRALTLIARLVSAAMGAGVVVIAWRIASLLWDRRTALVAAAIVFAPYPMFYYTKTGNLEIPYLFWSALGLLAFAEIMTKGPTAGRAARMGAFAGLAAAAKDQAGGLFFAIPLYFLPWNKKLWPHFKTIWAWIALSFFAAGAVTYAIGSGLALGPQRYLDHLHFDFIGDKVNAPFNDLYPTTITGALALAARIPSNLVWWFGPLLAVAFLVGIFRAERRIALGMLLPVASYTAFFLLPLHYFRARHTLPIGFILGLFAAHGLCSLLKSSRWIAVIAAVALAWPLTLSADLIYQMTHDSRVEAGKFLASAIPPQGSIADCGGSRKLPPLRPDVRIVELRDGAAAFDDLAAERPEYVAAIPDWTRRPGREISRVCPQALYDGLANGSLGYTLAGSFHTPSLIERQMMDYPTVNPPVLIYRRAP